jgi:protein-tyrosine phosphatase
MGFQWVYPRLAQGSVPTEPRLHHTFHTVVLAAEELQDVPLHGVEVVKVPLDDSGPPPTQQQVVAAVTAARHVVRRWREGRSVLVTCHLGRNRSGLITALSLMMLGMTDEQAIRAVRAARGPMALSNEHFVRVLAAAQARRERRQRAA